METEIKHSPKTDKVSENSTLIKYTMEEKQTR